MNNRILTRRAAALFLSAAVAFPMVQPSIAAIAAESETNYDVQIADVAITAGFYRTTATMSIKENPLTGSDRDKVNVRGAVRIGDKTYYTGYKRYYSGVILSFDFSYPEQIEGTFVSYWIEDNAGHKGKEQSAQVTKYPLDVKEVSAYSNKTRIFTGSFPIRKENEYVPNVRAVVKTPSGTYYSAYKRYDDNINSIGYAPLYNFTVNYDTAIADGETITYYFEDKDGNTTEEATAVVGPVRLPQAQTEFSSIKATVKAEDVPITDYEHIKLGVNIGGTTYYSSDSYSRYNTYTVEYPVQSQGTPLTWWFEDEDGIRTAVQNATTGADSVKIDKTAFYSNQAEITTSSFPFMKDDDYSSDSQKVRAAVKINGQVYYSEYLQKRYYSGCNFVVDYPEQPENTDITYWIEGDQYGKSQETQAKITYFENPKMTVSINTSSAKVFTENFPMEDTGQNVRLVVKAGDQKYYSDYLDSSDYNTDYSYYDDDDDEDYDYDDRTQYVFSVAYPEQSLGTKVQYWFEGEKYGRTPSTEGPVEYSYNLVIPDARVTASQKTLTIDADSFPVTGADSDKIKVRLVAVIGDETYQSDYMDNTVTVFKVSYPEQKWGTEVKYYFEDDQGYQTGDDNTVEIKNKKPGISFSGSNNSDAVKLTGSTAAKSTVIIKYKGKTKKVKSNASGKFSVKTGRLKAGTKIKISVTTPEKFTNSRTFKIKQAKGSVSLPKYTLRYTKKVSFTAKKVKKGDYLTLKVGKRSYRYKFRADAKTKKGTIRIKAPSTGSRITATLYDKFGGKKASCKDRVYYDNGVRVGMTSKQVRATTLGSPDKINSYSYGDDQWCYDTDGDGIYDFFVYVDGGKVTAWQDL